MDSPSKCRAIPEPAGAAGDARGVGESNELFVAQAFWIRQLRLHCGREVWATEGSIAPAIDFRWSEVGGGPTNVAVGKSCSDLVLCLQFEPAGGGGWQQDR
jgi:hypothetical protein